MHAKYIESKIDGKLYCKSNGQFTRHLKNNNLTYKEYYETYVTFYTPLCACLKPLTFILSDDSYAGSCGDPVCVGKNVSITKKNWTKEQKQSDSLNKRKSALSMTEETKIEQIRKTKETNIKKYGVEWASQSTQQRDKSKKTKLERYGNEYYNNNKKTSESWQSMNDDKIDSIVDKRRKTNLERYGVESVLMKSGILEKSMLSNSKGKKFVMPSGRIVSVRGYENVSLTKLLSIYDEIVIDFHDWGQEYKLPIFEYISYENRRMKYYPDIMIKTENKIIEIKGRWWWDAYGREGYKGRLVNNLRKRQSVIDAGYNYEVWLFEDKNTYRILRDDSDFTQQ